MVARIVGWTIGGFIVLVVLLYVGLVAVNWRDKDPSEAAIRFESMHRDRPVVKDTNNAYIFMMGFGVAPTEDPYEIGLSRSDWIEASKSVGKLNPDDDPHSDSYDPKLSRAKEVTELLDHCKPGGDNCAREFDRSDEILAEWLKTEGWLLERYQALLKFPQWRESSPFDVLEPLPPYHIAMDGQRLLLAKAMLMAKNNDARSAEALLREDVRFWRMVLQSSDLLISKMIATVALNRHFELGNVVLRNVRGTDALHAMPPEWQQPISIEERSMLGCFAGEWKFLSATMSPLEKSGSFSTVAFPDEERGLKGKIVDALFAPLFQYQDTTNKAAEHLLAIALALDVPYDEMGTGIAAATELSNRIEINALPPKSAYNPVGNILFGIASPTYVSYAKRVLDIEGTRRAALAAVTLRMHGVNADAVATELRASDIRDPYNNEPFAWDDETGNIVFSGVEENARRIHRILY